uniref:Uncharacterized protein n=1 Tax=Cercocebus atys TaxID=9531 RepID=A0A2K5MH10_CERAT
MILWALTCTLHSLSLAPPTIATPVPSLIPVSQVTNNALFQWPSALMLLPCHQILTSMALSANFVHTKYTIKPVKMKKSGGEDHTGQIRVHGIGRETKSGPFEEKVIQVHCDPCRSTDIALAKHWIIAIENKQAGDTILNSNHIGRMAVAAQEGDAHPLGTLPLGTLINSMESERGQGAQYIRAAGTCGVLLWKVNGTAIIQLPSKRQMQVLETLSNTDHNKQVTGRKPSSGLWHRKGCWAGRKIWPLPFMKSYVKLPSAAAQS